MRSHTGVSRATTVYVLWRDDPAARRWRAIGLFTNYLKAKAYAKHDDKLVEYKESYLWTAHDPAHEIMLLPEKYDPR